MGAPATRCFLPDQKILVLAKVIAFSNLEFIGNYTTRANFNRDLWKTKNLATKNLSSPAFFEITIWNFEDMFFRPIPRNQPFPIFEFWLHFFIMGNIRHEVFLSQLTNYNIAHNKKLKSKFKNPKKLSSRDWSKEDNFQVSGYYLKKWRRS